MDADIWIVRDGESYRLLYGHLHLASEMSMSGAVFVDVKNEGKVKVVRAPSGFFVDTESRQIPLRAS
ncbi:MAG: hypothetical protein HYZ65_01510 [Burkholderiales bacterium]|nr:hypothetical protein [Burkholderiales bacterium]